MEAWYGLPAFSAEFTVACTLGAFSQSVMLVPALLFGMVSLLLHHYLMKLDRSGRRPQLILTLPQKNTPAKYRVVTENRIVAQGATDWRSLQLFPTVSARGYPYPEKHFTILLLDPALRGVPGATTADLGDRIEPCLQLASGLDKTEMEKLLLQLQQVLGAP